MEELENISLTIGICSFALLIVMPILERRTNLVSRRLKALSILVICYGLAISFALIAIYIPSKTGFVLQVFKSGADKLIQLSHPHAIYTLLFNIGLVAVVSIAGTYGCMRALRSSTHKP